MLDQNTIKKINDFVYQKPRTIQEVSLLINKNWRTANSYVDKIAEQYGTLSIKIFREGTRGALKIVFWNNIENIHSSELQEKLFRKIESARRKTDFSPSEIYQFIDKNKKALKIMNEKEYTSKKNFEDFKNLLKSANSHLLFFSGNLTFSNIGHHDIKIREVIEDLGKHNISSKILTSVEMPGIQNIKNILAINERLGKKIIEVRHARQPLRATIIDNKVIVFKETFNPKDYQEDELKEKTFLLYYVYDPEWIEWLQKVFFNIYRTSVNAETRIQDFDHPTKAWLGSKKENKTILKQKPYK